MTDATRIFAELKDGDATAAQRLLAVVYPELHSLAAKYFHHQSAGHTLQATALVNEAFMRLVDQSGSAWNDREHFSPSPQPRCVRS